jgi:hypothetical protein
VDKRIGLTLAWVVAAVVAVSVGLAAVTTVGASIRGRGPLGSEVNLEDVREGTASPDPNAPRVRDTVKGEWGRFVVECQGAIAYGVSVRAAQGWNVVSYEQGPDDDVDAVFSSAGGSIDLEVFCNQGRPTISDLERNTLPDDD